jgi:hypothetical protein
MCTIYISQSDGPKEFYLLVCTVVSCVESQPTEDESDIFPEMSVEFQLIIL